MAPRMDWSKVTRDLWQHASELEAELARVYAALAALDGDTPQGTGWPGGSGETVALVIKALQTDPEQMVTAAEAVRLARLHGWATRSGDPVNAMRAALARAHDDGQLVRVRPGYYRLAPRMIRAEDDAHEVTAS